MYYAGKKYIETPLDVPVKLFGGEISKIDLREYIKYLGAPIAVRSHVKTSMSKVTVEKTLRSIKKVTEVGLKINQKVHLVRTFILPSLDYLFMNGQVKVNDLKKLDIKIREMFLTMFKGFKLPIDFFTQIGKMAAWVSISWKKESAYIKYIQSYILFKFRGYGRSFF
jgi:hypothetical protein